MNLLITTPFGQHNWTCEMAAPRDVRSRAEEYCAQAAQCYEASRSLDQLKQQYEELARQWLALATQAEKRETREKTPAVDGGRLKRDGLL